MSTTKEKIQVMQAYEDGADIEYSYNHKSLRWFTHYPCHGIPTWDWEGIEYRIKK